MKVVLFCGGRGLRLREHSEAIPKPMVRIGYRPILWHVMRYYAHYGHRDFILCLGYRADAIKDYFLHYDEAVSNDFVLSDGGKRVELLGSDIADWRITFADTGLDTHDRGAPAARPSPARGRGDVPGQLRRHPHRRAAGPTGRRVPSDRCRRLVPLGQAAILVSRGPGPRGRQGHRAARRRRVPTCGSTAGVTSSGRRSSIGWRRARI